jgi:general L-amino acid transport system permease protein
MGGGFDLTPEPTACWGGLSMTHTFAIAAIGVAFPLSILLALGRQSTMPVVIIPCVR